MTYRKLTVKTKNINRVISWLKLECDFAGYFSRNGERIGYKVAKNDNSVMYFYFKRGV